MKYRITKEAIEYVFGHTKAFRYPEEAKAICMMRLQGEKYEAIGRSFNMCKAGCAKIVAKAVRLYRERSRQ